MATANFVSCPEFNALKDEVDGIVTDSNKINAVSSGLIAVSSNLSLVSGGLSQVSSNLISVSSSLSGISSTLNKVSSTLSGVSSSLSGVSSTLTSTNSILSSVSSSIGFMNFQWAVYTRYNYAISTTLDTPSGVNAISKEITFNDVVNKNTDGGFHGLMTVIFDFNHTLVSFPSSPTKDIHVECRIADNQGLYDQEVFSGVIATGLTPNVQHLLIGGGATSTPFQPGSDGVYKVLFTASYADKSNTQGFVLNVNASPIIRYQFRT